DDFHSGSVYLEGVLDEAVRRGQRGAGAGLAGPAPHHPRLTRPDRAPARPVPLARAGGRPPPPPGAGARRPGATPAPPPPPRGREEWGREAYSDARYGSLRVTVSASDVRGEYLPVPGTHIDGDVQATPLDAFTVDLHAHTVATTPPGAGPAPPPARPPRTRRT